MEKIKKRTTVVFGGTGLVGSHLTSDLKPSRSQVDLRDIVSIRNFFRDNEFDTVINCAGNVGGLGKNLNQNLEMFVSNMEINYNLLKVIMENPGKVKKTVMFLSTCVFPAEVEYPLTEDKLHLGPPHFSNSGYAYAKRMTQVMADLMNESGEYGKIITVIPTNLYGPHDTFNKEDGHVIPALIAKCFEAVKADCALTAWGSGSPLREFLYVKDVADIIEIILDSYEGNKPLILSHGKEVTIKEAVLTVCEAMGLTHISWDTSKPDGQHKKPSDPSALLEVIGDYKFTPLQEGVEKAVKFYQENYPHVRT